MSFSRHKRIGIYAGTFNPVHAGHIAFALQAVKTGKLDRLYFLPERRPRHKHGVEHYAHRIAMLRAAVRPYPRLEVLETDDISFTVRRTLPDLQLRFPGARLAFLVGSDVVPYIPEWPLAERLLASSELIVGLRDNASEAHLQTTLDAWRPKPQHVTFIQSHAPDVSSHKIREALAARSHVRGLLASVARYSNRHWLYVSLVKIAVDKA